ISKPERLATQVAFLEANPDYLMLSTSIDLIDAEGHFLLDEERLASDAAIRDYIVTEHGNPFCHGAMMIRREVLEKVGYYREGFRTSQDYDYWLRILNHGKGGNLPLPSLYQYRVHLGQMSYQSYHRMQAEWDLCEKLYLARLNGEDDTALYEAGAKELTAT